MPKINTDGTLVPDWDGKTTVTALQNEYDSYASDISKQQFAKDKGISTNDSSFNSLYEQEYKNNSKSFYTITSSSGEKAYYYYGTDTTVRDQLKSNKHTLAAKKQTIRMNSSMADISSTFSQFGSEAQKSINQFTTAIKGTYILDKEARAAATKIAEDYKAGSITAEQKAAQISAFNQKYGTNIDPSSTVSQIKNAVTKTTGSIVNSVNQQLSDIKQNMEGTYTYSEAARAELQQAAAKVKSGEMSEEQKKNWITDFNTRYNTNVSKNATADSLLKTADKKNGILHVTGNDIAFAVKQEVKNLGNLSRYWDNSSNEVISKFTQQGITGDIMWDIVRGKYNKDDAARRDLEKLQKLVKEGKGNSEEAIRLRNQINEKYELGLSDDITADDISKVIDSDQKYTYKKKIRQIAEGIIQDKLNEQIRSQIENKIGGKLEDWGFYFADGDIVGTVRDIIRGNKVAFFHQEKFLKKMQRELETKIDKMITQKVNSMIDNVASSINSKIDSVAGKITGIIDPFRQKVDNVYNKLDTWLSNPQSAKLNIADKLDQLIKSPVDKVANFLDRIEPFRKLGINLGLSDMFRTVTQNFTKGLADKVYSFTKPFVEKALGIVSTVKTQIQKLITTIDKIKEKAKQLIEKWKDYIKNVVQEFTKKIVNELMKYVKIGIGNLVGGLSSGISSAIGGLF